MYVCVVEGGLIHLCGNLFFRQPGPMCCSASYWARISKMYYAPGCDDYADIFDDSVIYKDLELPFHKRSLKPKELWRAEANKVWDEFRALPDGARY